MYEVFSWGYSIFSGGGSIQNSHYKGECNCAGDPTIFIIIYVSQRGDLNLKPLLGIPKALAFLDDQLHGGSARCPLSAVKSPSSRENMGYMGIFL